MKKQFGLTMLELLVVMVIVAILASVAVPSFNETTKRNRMTANANEILSVLQLARAEALRRGGRVVVAASDGADWVNGVRLYFDVVNDNNFVDTDDEEIRIIGGFSDGAMISANGGSEALVFDSRGFVQPLDTDGTSGAIANAIEVLKICDDREGETGRNINILISGSVYISDADDC